MSSDSDPTQYSTNFQSVFQEGMVNNPTSQENQLAVAHLKKRKRKNTIRLLLIVLIGVALMLILAGFYCLQHQPSLLKQVPYSAILEKLVSNQPFTTITPTKKPTNLNLLSITEIKTYLPDKISIDIQGQKGLSDQLIISHQGNLYLLTANNWTQLTESGLASEYKIGPKTEWVYWFEQQEIQNLGKFNKRLNRTNLTSLKTETILEMDYPDEKPQQSFYQNEYALKGFALDPTGKYILYSRNGLWELNLTTRESKKLADNYYDPQETSNYIIYSQLDWSSHNRYVIAKKTHWDHSSVEIFDFEQKIPATTLEASAYTILPNDKIAVYRNFYPKTSFLSIYDILTDTEERLLTEKEASVSYLSVQPIQNNFYLILTPAFNPEESPYSDILQVEKTRLYILDQSVKLQLIPGTKETKYWKTELKQGESYKELETNHLFDILPSSKSDTVYLLYYNQINSSFEFPYLYVDLYEFNLKNYQHQLILKGIKFENNKYFSPLIIEP